MKNVGKKIKSVREAQKISIEEIAERTAMPLEQIQSIEENNILPSLTPLIKIARALGVRLGTFLDDQENFGPIICRNGNTEESIRFSNNSEQERKHMDYHALSGSKTDRHMEPFMIDIDPNKDDTFTLSSHEGEEFIFVLSGKVEINYGKETYLLNPGDSIYYDSIVNHHVHAGDDSSARILAVIYTPI